MMSSLQGSSYLLESIVKKIINEASLCKYIQTCCTHGIAFACPVYALRLFQMFASEDSLNPHIPCASLSFPSHCVLTEPWWAVTCRDWHSAQWSVSLACCLVVEAPRRDVLFPVLALSSQSCFPACLQEKTLDTLVSRNCYRSLPAIRVLTGMNAVCIENIF